MYATCHMYNPACMYAFIPIQICDGYPCILIFLNHGEIVEKIGDEIE